MDLSTLSSHTTVYVSFRYSFLITWSYNSKQSHDDYKTFMEKSPNETGLTAVPKSSLQDNVSALKHINSCVSCCGCAEISIADFDD